MSSGGEICLKTFVEGSNVVVTVMDNGIGVPEDLRDRIFDPFFSTKGVKSTGLGLSVSYGIITRHRGTIKINSIVNQGTTFTIYLPVPEQVVQAEVRDETPQASRKQKAKVLVVDDEKEVCAMLSDILSFEGHEVDTASDGFKAIDILSRTSYDIIFTDLGMPGMTGWELAKEIQQMHGPVPVVLMTGWSLEKDEIDMHNSGVCSILSKPFKMNEALGKISECLALP